MEIIRALEKRSKIISSYPPLTIGKGQYIGIFAGSGVGKSTLVGMIAKHMKAGINVIALIGKLSYKVLVLIPKSWNALFCTGDS